MLFAKILIANRGETACRVWRTCRRLGIPAATIHSSADRNALHVRTIGESVEVGAAPAAASYLNIDAVLEAARLTGADGVHPGIGFLAENPDFADAVEAAGLAFVGPTADTLSRFGDKWSAKEIARNAQVPTIDGSTRSAEPAALEAAIAQMQLPVLLKAAGGGGGRGIRVIRGLAGLHAEIESAIREAQASFGRPELLVEQYLEHARHIEVQIAGDGKGGVVHLYERECSLQRRFQKVVEEAPAVALPQDMKAAMYEAACRMASAEKFRGVGTIEFLASGDAFYFLECNPRLQVEHPVTECITGQDLVELQLRIAAGAGLPVTQADIVCRGHAIEARICAENPRTGFTPSTGTIVAAAFPETGVRVDSGVDAGSEVTPYYDSMVAKLIAHGPTRAQALSRLRNAVAETAVLGVDTNLSFLTTLLEAPAVANGSVYTEFIDRERIATPPAPAADTEALAIAACIWISELRATQGGDPWTRLPDFTGWTLSDGQNAPPHKPDFCLQHEGVSHEIALAPIDPDGWMIVAVQGVPVVLRVAPGQNGQHHVTIGSRVWLVRAATQGQTVHLHGAFGTRTFLVAPYLDHHGGSEVANGRLVAPMMGQIIKVNVQVGDRVQANDVVAVLESMKMELSILAPLDGVVAEVGCKQGDMVERNSFVAEVAASEDASG